MKFEIQHRFTGSVLFALECGSLKLCLQAAVKAKTDLGGADLRDADLGGADLRDADLGGAYLRGAYLGGAYLGGADLGDADLRDADLGGAYLGGAYLGGADLRDADLRGADLGGADLRDADLRGAYLGGAYLGGAEHATDEKAIVNLDKVREIILDDAERLEMDHWHGDHEWTRRSCAEEAVCGTTHCLAGWLQVCATDDKVRGMETQLAGIVQAPIASKMFFRKIAEVLDWLKDRKYVVEIEEGNKRHAERMAKRAAEAKS